MKILALDFSSPQRSAAVFQFQAGGIESSSEVIETGGRSTQALGMIEAALRQAQLEREQVECIALGLGPGSYTGIRAAISLAQGWQLARGVKLVGLSSAQCIAAQAQELGLRGKLAVVIDAQRNELYLEEYELSEGGTEQLRPLRLTGLAEARQCAQQGFLLAGPEVARWFVEGRVIFPSAAMLARLASSKTEFVAGEKLEPIYLRETQFVKAPPPRII